jgi:hypothetical protein
VFASAGLTSVLHFAVGIVVWKRADRLAGYVVSGKETPSSLGVLSASDLQAIAFSVVGLLVTLRAIPELVEIAFPYVAPRTVRESLYAYPVRYDRLAGLLVELVVGLGLLFYSQGFIGILKAVSRRNKESKEKK